jgi:hypothetical protein
LSIKAVITNEGTVRQYRMAFKMSNGAVCFRCSKCDNLHRTNSSSNFVPKITVVDGEFPRDEAFPEHHPQCIPSTKAEIIIQQIRRRRKLNAMAEAQEIESEV